MDSRLDALIRQMLARLQQLESAARLAPGRKAVQGALVVDVAIVKLTGEADGGEKYLARRFKRPTGGVSQSGNLTEADLGSLPDADDCLFLNGEQVAASNSGTSVDNTGHVLTANGRLPYAVGLVFGDRTTDTPSLLVVRGLSALTRSC